ncbi:hypothetical protein D9758_017914 [Tetrapyrgos nigripes]|uniref:2OGFeDO JBP1/TET oxygenase domain-containing protein n=1 Tax=Tetrapyrgos nigripes TaxID=182062 RepID=A0A8H5FEM3_9AGAR|nr:hypothetical protein D9758_017914 [Tetrapyrgos nigripes]
MGRTKHRLNVFCDSRWEEHVLNLETYLTTHSSTAIALGWTRGVDINNIAQQLKKAMDHPVVLPICAVEYFGLTIEKRHGALAKWRNSAQRHFSAPTVITDQEGISLIWYLPNLLNQGLQAKLLRATSLINCKLASSIRLADHSWQEHEYSKTQRGWRDDENLFVPSCRHSTVVPGVRNFSFGWRGSGHLWTEDPVKTSRSLTHNARDIPNTQQWLESVAPLQLTVSLILSFIHPELYQAGKTALDNCCKPSADLTQEWAKRWNSVYTALCVISSHRAVPHVDSHGDPKYLDALASLGTTKKAKMVFHELNASFSYNPGTVMFFSGKGWTHEVPLWGVGDRVCYASYMRPEMMAEHNVEVSGYLRIVEHIL